jgi:hypothetical protein
LNLSVEIVVIVVDHAVARVDVGQLSSDGSVEVVKRRQPPFLFELF